MSFLWISEIINWQVEPIDLLSVFLISAVEKFMPAIPSYVLFPVIGMSASSALDLLLRCLVATAGSVTGAAVWYFVGAAVGPLRVRGFIARYGLWLLLKPQFYERLAASYQHRPFRVTVIGQLIPTVRIFHGLPAGVLRLSLLPFLAATAIGAQCWIVPLSVGGFLLRRQGWSAVEIGLGLMAAILTIELLVLLAVIARAWLRRRALRQSFVSASVIRSSLPLPGRCE
jgi:membrane protein DedA with SNARE-associated domain